MARKVNRYTIYDMMEEKGVFEANPANVSARDPVTGMSTYAGPVQFPKMLYHPTGETIVTVPAEIIVTPIGPQRVGEKRKIKTRIVHDEEELKLALAEGWHDKPNKSAAVAKGEEIPLTKDDQIRKLQEQIAQLQLQANDKMAEMVKPAPSVVPRPRVHMERAMPPTE